MQIFRLFVSSPSDASVERRRVETVVSRLNGEFSGLARLEAVRWETEHYRAHTTFQTQIPEAANCDLVVGVLRWRLGVALPPDFPQHLPDGEAFPSGTAYELLSAIEKRKTGADLPDVFVFRYGGGAPSVTVDHKDEDEIKRQWKALEGFFARWFVTPQGQFKAAFNSYGSEDDFEAQLEILLRKWLSARANSGKILAWPQSKGSPFRGLSVFGARHAPVFFGRAADIRRASDAWRSAADKGTPFLLIIGASGSGKSSLARAGLISRLTTPGVVKAVDFWRVAVMRPGDSRTPFLALAEALLLREPDLPPEEAGRGPALPEIAEGDSKTPAELAAVLEHADAPAVKPIVNALERIGERLRDKEHIERRARCDLVLLVDQLDELFAPSLPADTRDKFAALLAALIATGRVWLAATLRADLYASLLDLPALKKLKDSGASYDLSPPGAAELVEVVRLPAKAAGLTFDADKNSGETLDERLLREADRPDMLPLVQLALSRLWEARETRGDATVLPVAAYEKLGGVKGIVAEAGESALRAVGEAEQQKLAPLIRKLAEVTAAGALSARAVVLKEAAPDDATRKLVEALVAARLLTLSGEGGSASLRLAHQRVLSDWARAEKIVVESGDFYRVRDEVEDQRRRWAQSGKKGELLLARGLPLAEAGHMQARYGTELSSEIVVFIAASRRRANRTQALTVAAAAVFALVAAGAGVEWKRAAEQEKIAERNFEAARTTVDGLTFNVAQGLRNVAGMRVETTRKILETAQKTMDQLLATAPDDARMLRSKSAMLDEFAQTFASAGDLRAAMAAATESLAIARKLAAQDSGNAEAQRYVSITLYRVGDVKLREGDSAGALAACQEGLEIDRKLAAQDPGNAQAQRDLLVSLSEIGDVKLHAGDGAGALAAFQESLEIARKIAADSDNAQAQRDVATTLQRIGDVKLRAGNGAGALAVFQEDLVIARKLAAQDPGNAQAKRDLSASLHTIGAAKLDAGDGAGALAVFQESLEIARKLAAQDPGNVRAQRDVSVDLERIGDVKLAAGDGAGALAAFQESLEFARKVAADTDNAQAQRDVVVSLQRIGDAKLRVGDGAGALAVFQESLEFARKLAAQDPGNVRAQRDVSVDLERIGDVKLAAGDGAGALAAYQEDLEIARKLAVDNDNSQAQRGVVLSLQRIGNMKARAGDGAGALAAYQESLEIARKLVAQDSGNAQAQRDLLVSLSEIGDVKLHAGDGAGALAAYQEDLEIARKLAADTDNAQAQRDVMGSLKRIGDVKLDAGDGAGALAAFQESLEFARKLALQERSNAQTQGAASVVLAKIATLKLRLDDGAGALAAAQEGLDIARKLAESDPGNADAQRYVLFNLDSIGNAKQGTGALAAYGEGLEIARKLAARDPDDAQAQRVVSVIINKIGVIRLGSGDYAGALAAFQESLEFARKLAAKDTTDMAARKELISALGAVAFSDILMRHYSDALSSSDEAIALASDQLWLKTNRAHALMLVGRLDEARGIYLEHRGKTVPSDGSTWEQEIEGDFAEFRKAGITHPLMDEIAAAFAKPAAPAPKPNAKPGPKPTAR